MVDRANASYRIPEDRIVEVDLGGGIKTFQQFKAGDEIPLAYAEEVGVTDETYKPPKGAKRGSKEPGPDTNAAAPPPANTTGDKDK